MPESTQTPSPEVPSLDQLAEQKELSFKKVVEANSALKAALREAANDESKIAAYLIGMGRPHEAVMNLNSEAGLLVRADEFAEAASVYRKALEWIVHSPVQCNDWGHTPRNNAMPICRGEYALHMDDDDTFAPDAFKNVRKAIAEEQKNVYIFKMQFSSGNRLWKDKWIGYGNTGTPMIVHKLDLSSYGVWEPFHGGDGFFMQTTAILNENSISWRDETIAHIRPHDPHS